MTYLNCFYLWMAIQFPLGITLGKFLKARSYG